MALTFRNGVNQVTREQNASDLSQQLPRFATIYGVDSLHLVMHSKGGLDTRQYLEGLNRASGQPTILSYASLSTPHDGSVLADLTTAANDEMVIAANSVEYENIPGWGALSTFIGRRFSPINGGHTQLTTADVAQFNRRNVRRLPQNVVYTTVGADMDLNGSGDIDVEIIATCNPPRREDAELAWDDPLASTYTAGKLYRILRTTRVVYVVYPTRRVTIDGVPTTVVTAVITGVAHPAPVGNDVLVTIPSAAGINGFQSVVTHRRDLTACNGRNHASIGGAPVFVNVLPGILQAEADFGDMRP